MIGAVFAASDAPVYISAVGALLVALATASGVIATRRTTKVASDVAVIDSVQRTQMETIDYQKAELKQLREDVKVLRDEVKTLEGKHDACEDARRTLTSENLALNRELARMKGPQ